MDYESKIIELVKQDNVRVRALDAVFELKLPDCFIAAGFVRNLVWDYLHGYGNSTPLNDIDVIYFDPNSNNENFAYQYFLKNKLPELNWQVKNQASMHLRNGDRAYINAVDAMSFWPERETAVAIRKIGNENYECVSAFGFESLFHGKVSYNPKRNLDVFRRRIKRKAWLNIWPKLHVIV